MEEEGKTEVVAEEREKSPNPVPIEQEGEFEDDDESHWRRMVREVADEEEPPSKNPKTDVGNEDSWSRVTNRKEFWQEWGMLSEHFLSRPILRHHTVEKLRVLRGRRHAFL
ncbi:hypothetical protein COOONC_12027 [Cooperia oncophora]